MRFIGVVALVLTLCVCSIAAQEQGPSLNLKTCSEKDLQTRQKVWMYAIRVPRDVEFSATPIKTDYATGSAKIHGSELRVVVGLVDLWPDEPRGGVIRNVLVDGKAAGTDWRRILNNRASRKLTTGFLKAIYSDVPLADAKIFDEMLDKCLRPGREELKSRAC